MFFSFNNLNDMLLKIVKNKVPDFMYSNTAQPAPTGPNQPKPHIIFLPTAGLYQKDFDACPVLSLAKRIPFDWCQIKIFLLGRDL